MNIDLVLTWQDPNDSDYQKMKDFYLKSFSYANNNTTLASVDLIFSDKDNIKYFFRCIDKHAKFINNIFIVTNGQIPQWLNYANDKVKLVPHKQIIPDEFLPTFNPYVIEHCFKNIPGLSEYFLYARDSIFFAQDIDEHFFFNEKNFPIIRFKKFAHLNYELKSLNNISISNTIKLLNKKFGIRTRFFEHCDIEGYYRPDVLECIDKIQDEVIPTLNNKFRAETDINKIIWTYYSYYLGHATLRHPFLYVLPNWLKIFFKPIYNLIRETQDIPLSATEYKIHKQTKMFYFTQDIASSINDQKRATDFLESYFPEKSSFEK